MKVLITGHLGFIGTYLIKQLKGSGIQWDGYDLQTGDDIRNKLQLEKVFESGQYDVVIHMAALAGVRRGEEYPEEYISTNINGTRNIVELCEKYKCKLIFFSSSSVLGGNTDENGLVEGLWYKPKSLYAITKVTGEYLVKNMSQQYFIIRPFTVYGSNGRPDMVIYKWINQIKKGKAITYFGDGLTSRGYTYVEDLVEAIVALLKKIQNNEIEESRIINLGGSERIFLKDMLEIFDYECRLKGILMKVNMLELPVEDVVDSYAEIAVARQLLNFNPKPNFKKILTKILKQEL